MFDKDTLRDEMLRECDIIRHLASKIPDGSDDWKPTDGQRTMLQFLRYLSFAPLGGAGTALADDWAPYAEGEKAAAELRSDEFDAAMLAQKDALAALMDGITDEQWANQTCHLPTGAEVPLWQGVFELSYRWLAGYRMQLFLYAKGAGNSEISTANVWMGIDWKRPDAD